MKNIQSILADTIGINSLGSQTRQFFIEHPFPVYHFARGNERRSAAGARNPCPGLTWDYRDRLHSGLALGKGGRGHHSCRFNRPGNRRLFGLSCVRPQFQ